MRCCKHFLKPAIPELTDESTNHAFVRSLAKFTGARESNVTVSERRGSSFSELGGSSIGDDLALNQVTGQFVGREGCCVNESVQKKC